MLTDRLPIIPYPNKKAGELEKELALYSIEKKLYYGVFFLLGKSRNPMVKDRRVCAPLFLFPAEIHTIDGEKYLSIARDNFEINRSCLSLLDSGGSEHSIDSFVVGVSELLTAHSPDFIRLKSLVEKYFDNVTSQDLLMTPEVWRERKIKAFFKSDDYAEESLRIVPAAGTVLIQKSESSLKVVNDLSAMAKSGKMNSSLRSLLTGHSSTAEVNPSIYRSRLNRGQYTALENAFRHENSVVIGPPGTGKTYTITSMVSEAVLNGQSVLVVSKTKQAVEVLRAMLEDDFHLKKYLVHTTGHAYRNSLKSKIRRYLSGILPQSYGIADKARPYKWFKKLVELEERFSVLVERELKISDLELSSSPSLIDKWQKLYFKVVSSMGRSLSRVFEEMEEITVQLDSAISTYTKKKIQNNVDMNTRYFRKDLAAYFDALDSGSFSEYKKGLERVNHRNILKVFPIWLANLPELNTVVPLEPDLFDLVVIDEATQCDIAMSLPALYRAKRAVVVGDPNQLRHYSFISVARQNELRISCELPNEKRYDYRNRSILDLCLSELTDQSEVSFLREHLSLPHHLSSLATESFTMVN